MEINNDRYTFTSKVDALGIAEKYNCPVYVYDAAVIKSQYEKLSSAFDVKSLRINYACKALTNINILRYIQSLGAGLDTVSIQELKLGLRAGFSPNDILYTPNGVSIQEITEAVKHGVQITIDNLSILEQFGDLFPGTPVCIRVNPHIMAGGNKKISVGHVDSKFGISIHQIPHVVRIVEATGIKINGLHMHTGSDILDAEVFILGADVLFEVARNFESLEYIDFGSGFKIDYKGDGICTDVEDLGVRISRRFKAFCKSYGRDVTLMFEPGKYLVSSAGTFLTRVNVIKQTTSTVFAGVDSGLNHLIRPMLYDAYHRITNISKTKGRTRIYTVVGYICETDTFGADRRLTEVHEGDVLAFSNAGAYGWMMSSNYNSRYRPAEVLILDGKDYLIRRRETMEDLLHNQVEVDVLRPKIETI